VSREPSKHQVLRDRRDSHTLHRAAEALRRRTAHVADPPELNGDEVAAVAAVLDAAARHVQSLTVGLRSDLLAAADVVLRSAIVTADQRL
jgi:hypothetical protein